LALVLSSPYWLGRSSTERLLRAKRLGEALDDHGPQVILHAGVVNLPCCPTMPLTKRFGSATWKP